MSKYLIKKSYNFIVSNFIKLIGTAEYNKNKNFIKFKKNYRKNKNEFFSLSHFD